MKRPLKVLLVGCLFSVCLCLLAPIGFRLWFKYEHHLPSEQLVRKGFENHQADYEKFVTLLSGEQSAPFRVIDRDGRVSIHGLHSRLVPEYRDLIRQIGAKDVTIREDGSIEFSLYGFGCAICSDSHMGVRYVPKDRGTGARAGWQHTVVTSLDSEKLPHENGAIATGLYVVPIEHEWFVYRFEYQE